MESRCYRQDEFRGASVLGISPPLVPRLGWPEGMSVNLSLHDHPVALHRDVTERLPAPSRTAEAVADLAGGLSRAWIWTKLAYQDIKLRYRGSVLGPFWVTLTNLVMIVAIGAIYGTLFKVKTEEYVPYVMMGLLIWQFVSGMINEGCTAFTETRDVIQQVKLPFSLQAYRGVYRNLIVLAHNAVLIPLGLMIYPMPLDWHVVNVIPALAVLSIDGFWITLFLGMISARFRDIPPIVNNIVQVLFFMTPIFWPMGSAGKLKEYLALNPFFAAIDVVRAPLLGVSPEPTSWPLLLGCTVVLSLCGYGFFVRFRERIAYWV
jgi:ABC-2 type transport system permease protein/lipopolysaccharide transport system permease protein